MPSVIELLREGKLPVGTVLTWKRRTGPVARLTVEPDGSLLDDGGQRHRTLSGAAKSLTGKPVDGWLAWKLPNGEPIASLRKP